MLQGLATSIFVGAFAIGVCSMGQRGALPCIVCVLVAFSTLSATTASSQEEVRISFCFTCIPVMAQEGLPAAGDMETMTVNI